MSGSTITEEEFWALPEWMRRGITPHVTGAEEPKDNDKGARVVATVPCAPEQAHDAAVAIRDALAPMGLHAQFRKETT